MHKLPKNIVKYKDVFDSDIDLDYYTFNIGLPRGLTRQIYAVFFYSYLEAELSELKLKEDAELINNICKDNYYERSDIAKRKQTSTQVLNYLAYDIDWYVRCCVASNTNTTSATLSRLWHDECIDVFRRVLQNANTNTDLINEFINSKYFLDGNSNHYGSLNCDDMATVNAIIKNTAFCGAGAFDGVAEVLRYYHTPLAKISGVFDTKCIINVIFKIDFIEEVELVELCGDFRVLILMDNLKKAFTDDTGTLDTNAYLDTISKVNPHILILLTVPELQSQLDAIIFHFARILGDICSTQTKRGVRSTFRSLSLITLAEDVQVIQKRKKQIDVWLNKYNGDCGTLFMKYLSRKARQV